MRRALASLIFFVGACGGSTPPAALVVQDQDAAPPSPSLARAARRPDPGRRAPRSPMTATAATKEGGASIEAVSPEVAVLRKCNDPALKETLQSTIELAKKGPISDRALVDALWSCFARFRPSQAGTSIMVVRDLQAAVMTVKDPSYGAKAIAKIEEPVADPKDPAEGMDQIQFWQATAIRLLGELRHAPGARPLVKVLLDENKKDLTFPTRLALQRMPKESEPLLIATLAGTDAELAQLANKSPDRAFVPRIAEPLAYISRPAGRDAILDALAKANNDSNRAVLAVYLTYFPPTARTLKAFTDACAKIPANATLALMGGANARAVLVGAAANFFDPSLVPFILRENAAAKGDAADAMPASALPAAMKLMMPENAKAVAAEVNKIPGKAIEKEMYAAALVPLDACKKDVPCWLKQLAKPVSSSPPAAKMGHVKAAWMVAMLGKPENRAELVKVLLATTDGSLRLALLEAIDHLSPNGDVAIAEELEKYVDQQKAAGLMAGLDEMLRIALKLRSRAL